MRRRRASDPPGLAAVLHRLRCRVAALDGEPFPLAVRPAQPQQPLPGRQTRPSATNAAGAGVRIVGEPGGRVNALVRLLAGDDRRAS